MRLFFTFSVAILSRADAQPLEVVQYENGWSTSGRFRISHPGEHSPASMSSDPWSAYPQPPLNLENCSLQGHLCQNGTTCEDHCETYTRWQHSNWQLAGGTTQGYLPVTYNLSYGNGNHPVGSARYRNLKCVMVCECDLRTHYWRRIGPPGPANEREDFECVRQEKNECEDPTICPDGALCVNYVTEYVRKLSDDTQVNAPTYDCLCGPVGQLHGSNPVSFGQVAGDLLEELAKIQTRHWSPEGACVEVLEDMVGKWKSDWIYKSVTVDTTDEILSEIKLDYNGTGGEAGFGKSSEHSKTCARFLPGDGCDNGKWTYIDDKVPENSFQFCDRMATWSHKPKWPF